MVNFERALTVLIANEGGHKLHAVAGDRGGQTYADIASNYHPHWRGWHYIDDGSSRIVKDDLVEFCNQIISNNDFEPVTYRGKIRYNCMTECYECNLQSDSKKFSKKFTYNRKSN